MAAESIRSTFDTLTSFTRTVAGFGSGVGSAVGGAVTYMTARSDASRGLEQMSHGKLIELADLVHDVFRGDALLEPPSICVVGIQSAGKSITLNGICGLDILPNGKSIVTRTPIHIRLLHATSSSEAEQIKVEFFEYSDSGETKTVSKYKVDLTCPPDQILPIREEIERLTEIYAGTGKNVVDKPINIRITSPRVPNLSIIDLPGLTQVALRDKGQPANIRENIEKMLIKYISSPKTIILAIVAATSDVEADMGLGLIKRFDPDFERTIGVLTKVDILTDSDVERYLLNTISKDLQMRYGYFAVKNRSTDEIATNTVEGGYGLEQKFFSSHPVYSKSDAKDRMGVINLANRLSEILISHLKMCLPSVIEEIRKLDKNLEAKLDEIGRDYPVDAEAKRSVMNILLSEFQKTYDQAITGRGAEFNTGALIKRSISDLKVECSEINPFSPEIYTDAKIKEIIDDYDGIHMSSSAISTGVIEALFQGSDSPHPYYNLSGVDNHPSLSGYRISSSRSSAERLSKLSEKSSKQCTQTDNQTNNQTDNQSDNESAAESGAASDAESDTMGTMGTMGFVFSQNDGKKSKSVNPTNQSKELELALLDIDVRRCDPLTVLIDPYRRCMRTIQMQLIDLTANILEKERFSRFPKLCSRIRDIITNTIVPIRYQEVIADIEKRIVAEKRCVWTDDSEFNTKILPSVINVTLNKKNSKNDQIGINPDAIRRVLFEYFKIIRTDLMTFMHKQIIAFFVKEVVSDVNTGLNDKILEKSTINVLLEENKDKAAKRAELYALKQKINSIKTMIKDME